MTVKREIFLLFFSLIVGIVVGFVEVLFGKGLLLVTEWRNVYFKSLIVFLPLAGLVIHFLYARFGGKSKEGMGLIFKVARGEEGKVPFVLIPIVIVSTWLTHLFGGSAGREGVAVQIGGALSNWISKSRVFFGKNVPEMSRLSIVVGMSAGFAGLFQTPLAATFFAIEVLIAGKLELRVLFYAGVAAYTSFFFFFFFLFVKTTLFIENSLNMSPVLVLQLIFLGMIFGLVGSLFTKGLKESKKYFQQLIPNGYMRIFIGALFLGSLLFVLHEGRYSGLGTNLILNSFQGETIYTYDFLLKMLLTIFTLSIGFQGGEVTPLFAIGSSLGVVLAPLVGLPIEIVACLGYVAVFGSATNTLLAPIFIGGEIFGFDLIPYFFIVMMAAYNCNFNTSIYGHQKQLDEEL